MRQVAFLAVVFLATTAFSGSIKADLVITEVMSNSDHPGGAANGDWFELHNNGATSIDLENYYWDDDGPTGNDGALFPAISIAASETIVIVDENAENLPNFISAWGGGFRAISSADFGGPDDFSSLSSNGDQIEIWEEDPNLNSAATLVASVVFGDSDGGGKSFEWLADGTDAGFSVASENGAFVAIGDGAGGTGIDIGSPGVVAAAIPEPTSCVLLALLGLGVVCRRVK